MVEKINLKLEEIRKQKTQVMADYNALCGAEQVLVQLLEEIKSEEE